jgi:hypothetical protein
MIGTEFGVSVGSAESVGVESGIVVVTGIAVASVGFRTIVVAGLAVGVVTGITSVVGSRTVTGVGEGTETQDQPVVPHELFCLAQRHCVAPPLMKQAASVAPAGITLQQSSPSTMRL